MNRDNQRSLFKVLYGVAVFTSLMGLFAMFAAKIAANMGGVLFSRSEGHWFNDSITALLFSISLSLLVLIVVLRK